MQQGFDPYHKWLGIPPQEQPANHYRLLAIPLFESDPEVIESAANQRMGHVRTFQAGRYSTQSQQILNELAAARVCLLSAEKKAAYDAELEASLAPPLPLPPQQHPPTSAILPSPPPPLTQVPPPPASQSQIAGSPVQPVVSQPAPPYPPLESTLPDPAPPTVVVTRSVPSRSKQLSLVATAVGITILLSAGVLFWLLYTDQTLQESTARNEVSPTSESQPVPEPTPSLPVADDEDAQAEPESEKPVDTTDSVEEENEISSKDADKQEPPVLEPEEPDERSSMTHLREETANPAVTKPRSLAELFEESNQDDESGTNDMDGSDEEPLAESSDDSETKKWRVPKPAALTRAAGRMEPVHGDFNALLIEAQKSDRPSTEVYILLTAAHDKAVAASNPSGALQAIDLIEERFLGDFDDQRVTSLRAIGLRLVQQKRNTRQFQDLADVALQASQEAQQENNIRLARNLGNVALEAAKKAGDAVRLKTITAHLDRL